ncbi:G-type lectin S-receptor-like serine/threonine-protein kinase B120 isoform X2 [Hevea brasiliensis]|uniref:G-type lectin S-receptor-like serine/threonine-protein kinase B120 isoform X2 n=1 Tax=Hevea brasiliensis TaxID=3981 RepID=UPI0025DE89B2|nr:G-type lectin S-receptor-like serine/threonine-protein kinase B120 isoform X2 [Hevea brasiliensis]
MAFMSKKSIFLFSFFFSLFSLVLFCHAIDRITKGQSIKDGETLVSADENFELGFFNPGNSSLRYFGIWYHKIPGQPVIWVANRENPISGTKGSFAFGEDGNFTVKDGNNISVWSSNSPVPSVDSAVAILENEGNLKLLGSDNITVYWESFDNPTDTFLPNMRILASSGVQKSFSSWKSATDPSPGNFAMGVDSNGAPQMVLWENSRRRWRSGYWDGQIFTGVPNMTSIANFKYGFKYINDGNGNYYFTYNPANSSDFMRFHITWDGYEEQLKWNESENKWDRMQIQPANNCELYNYCGNFGVCKALANPECRCMEGFVPRNQEQWAKGNWSGGCVRRTELQCLKNISTAGEDGFKELKCNKLPDFAVVYGDLFEDCQKRCLSNCSCNAFARVENIGCMIWNGDLIDVQDFGKPGLVMQLRLAASEFDSKRKLSAGVIVLIVVAGVVFLAISVWLLWCLKRKLKASVLPTAASVSLIRKSEMPFSDMSKSKEYSSEMSGPADLVIDGSPVNGPDLPLFNFKSVAEATNNFSEENKLGQGGFGHVYKGKLPGGEEIAVKRLSRISGQGLEEFKNEIILIAKLQHRNLVRLLGCCIQGEEKMLLYEYMPNKSLDFFLFDPAKQALLDWKKRFSIIEGIARGLLYLHRDSRLRIIHRDLKASNILLDEEMNPKISDFGMARIFGGNQNELNTNRVVGTYGYMSPEYAMEGLFSVKSDVYSFGVLLLEIVSGRRNTSFRLTDHVSLVAYAWDVWHGDKAMEAVDPSIRDSCCENEVLKCIQVGMLCVQDSAVQRPTMSSVVLMLESNNPTLPLPRQPTYTSMRTSMDTLEIDLEGQEIVSSNDVTVTMIDGR